MKEGERPSPTFSQWQLTTTVAPTSPLTNGTSRTTRRGRCAGALAQKAPGAPAGALLPPALCPAAATAAPIALGAIGAITSVTVTMTSIHFEGVSLRVAILASFKLCDAFPETGWWYRQRC